MARHENASFVSGGTELTLLLKMGLVAYDHLIDIKKIPDLRGISDENGEIRIGATVTHAEIENSSLIADRVQGLAALERTLANVRVRSTGTIGGNICFAEPHSDPAPFLLAWGAELELSTGNRTRRRPFDGFIIGPREADRDIGELLISVRLPQLPPGTAVVHKKVAFLQRPAANVGVQVGIDDGTFVRARIAVGGVGNIAVLINEAAAPIIGEPVHRAEEVFAEAAEIASARCEAYGDLNGSAEYKRQLIRALVSRALDDAQREVERGA